jgi:hypothetical protein
VEKNHKVFNDAYLDPILLEVTSRYTLKTRFIENILEDKQLTLLDAVQKASKI